MQVLQPMIIPKYLLLNLRGINVAGLGKNYADLIDQYEVLKIIGHVSDELGMETYVVGGLVRDYLLKRSKGKSDIDIVTVGSGIDLAREVAARLTSAGSVQVFKNFGTAMFRADNVEIEFVGARKESYRKDSRKPIVEDGTLQDDQNRRDFTINAMAISLNKNNFGILLDPFDGMGDLERRIVRTPLRPDITFSDDPLRMMRAIRFAAELNFDIDPDTFEAINQHAERIDIVSRERISVELEKIIKVPKPSYGFNLLFHAGLLKHIFREMADLHGVEKREGKGHKDNFFHTLKVLDNVAEKSDHYWLRWAAILHDIAKPPTKRFDKKAGWTFHGHEDLGARMVPRIFRELKIPMHDNMKYVQKLVRLHLRPIALVQETITDSAIRRLLFEAGDDIDDLMLLCRADITSKNKDKVQRYLNNFVRVEQKLKEVEEKDHVRNFQPPISGEEIMKTFGLEPCREVGIIKNEIKEAILDGTIHNSYEDAFVYMIQIGEKLGLKKF